MILNQNPPGFSSFPTLGKTTKAHKKGAPFGKLTIHRLSTHTIAFPAHSLSLPMHNRAGIGGE
jgi:hypothetical protein